MAQKNSPKRDGSYLQHNANQQGKVNTRKDSAQGKFSSHEKAVSNPVPGKNGGKNK